MQSHGARLLKNWFSDTKPGLPKDYRDSAKLERQSQHRLLALFREASEFIPAYKKFLKKHNVNPSRIHSMHDFCQIPCTSKENYIYQYSVRDRCWGGKILPNHVISTSSGTEGKPQLWPRDLQMELDGARAHETIIGDVLQIKDKHTLFVNAFALGNWIAGTFTQVCINLLSWKGYPITLISPGYSLEMVLESLHEARGKFKNVFIAGHTPFLKELVEGAVREKIDVRKINISLLGTGQGITENWRSYILNLLQTRDYYHRVINLYGSADAALMGFETPLSIYIRKILTDKTSLSEKIFDDERLPALYNYDPRLIYFEAIAGELCISKNSSCPLIRYNIHDRGGVLFGQQIASHIKFPRAFAPWNLPFVYLFGREKFMVKIYGANIYTEHVQQALNNRVLQKELTGRFLLEDGFTKNNDPLMICRVEVNKNVGIGGALDAKVRDVFVAEVQKLNSEYRDVCGHVGERAYPVIYLHKFGDELYFPRGTIKKTA